MTSHIWCYKFCYLKSTQRTRIMAVASMAWNRGFYSNFYKNLIKVAVGKREISTSVVCLKIVPNNLKNKSTSSQKWLLRHLNDPYVKRAKFENFRARSAFKLIEIDDKYQFLKPGHLVLDCGAAPGAWTQVATKRVNARCIDPELNVGKVVAIDLHYTSPIEGAIIISHSDFTVPESQHVIKKHFNGAKLDVILSDMAPNATGINSLDNENIVCLASAALAFAVHELKPGGTFLCKVWDGASTVMLEKHIQKLFMHCKNVKPRSSRVDSTEMFFLGTGFKGVKPL